jgi:hypothetical protein
MLSRFFGYIDKVFDFGKAVAKLKDSRSKPQITTTAIWLSAFVMFATRRRSLNAIEVDLRVPKRLDDLIGSRKPSVDTIGRDFCLIDTELLRAMLSGVNHQLGRNKALYNDWPIRIAAVDGHEFFSQSASMLQGMLSTPDQGQ